MNNRRILVIEDETNIQELLKYNLEKNEYSVEVAGNGTDGMEQARNNTPDLILLDIMLPGIDGLEVCKMLRMDKRTRKIPIFMLTAKGEDMDKILGLELGADDYITKPFSIKELIARIRAAIRRKNEDSCEAGKEEKDGSVLRIRDIEINSEKHEARKNGKKLVLTLKEFKLLKMLAENANKVMTRDFLLDKIWGFDYAGETRTVDVHIRHLRQKIEDEEGGRRLIETIRGVGYRLNGEGEN